MSNSGLNLFIPIELLFNSLNGLNLSEKQQILHFLDNVIAEAEENEATTQDIQVMSKEYTNINHSKFTHETLENNFTEKALVDLREQLKEGAIQRAERDLGLAEEWFQLEVESCQIQAK